VAVAAMPTMADLLNAGHGRLTLGCPILDAAMRGGVPTRCITELTGESTASKTQLCLQMLLTVSHSVSRAAVGHLRRTRRRYNESGAPDHPAVRRMQAQEPTHRGGLGGGALYIHTEGPAPVGRLRQMAEARQALAHADGRGA
jgi:RecA/RadA recombinase